MTSTQVTEVIRACSKTVNPNGSFIPGRQSDASLNYDAPGDQIHYDYPRRTVSLENAATSVYTIRMFFCKQDTLANLPAVEYDNILNPGRQDAGVATQAMDSRMALMDSVNTMIDNFLILINEVKDITISGANTDPAILEGAGGYTGYVLTFSLSTSNGYCANV